MIKRLFDICTSMVALLLLILPFFLIAFAILVDSKGGVFYRQKRIGKNEKEFLLFKFRSMHVNAEQKGLITVGNKDVRTTKVGRFLRKYKLDELPQLFNIILNEMSVVGPRPEVKEYVELYSVEQKKVLSVKPGLTDLASLAYINENEILGKAENPEKTYLKEIMPQKLDLNLEYIQNKSFGLDLKIIFKTIGKILS